MIYTLLINSFAVFLSAYFLKGVEVKNFLTAVIVAICLAIVNAFIRPVLIFLTLPVTIITLGLFILVINALMIMLVDKLLDDFKVQGFGWAFIFGIVLSVINGILFWLF